MELKNNERDKLIRKVTYISTAAYLLQIGNDQDKNKKEKLYKEIADRIDDIVKILDKKKIERS